MVKRDIGEVKKGASNSVSSKAAKVTGEQSSFVKGTTEAVWKPRAEGEKEEETNEDREYILRFIHGDTCCESPYADIEDWPVLTYTTPSEDAGEEDHEYILSVIAGVWSKDTGKFVAFWGADEGDGHVDFYCSNDFEHVHEFNELSGILCTEICPPLIDVFDDGSGKDRDPVLIEPSVFTNELLNNLYRKD
ncbi:hypothetical protein EON65_32545 [archaeon]|nr:MAG: hypothetical protein EON65_32545 [archaeon]